MSLIVGPGVKSSTVEFAHTRVQIEPYYFRVGCPLREWRHRLALRSRKTRVNTLEYGDARKNRIVYLCIFSVDWDRVGAPVTFAARPSVNEPFTIIIDGPRECIIVVSDGSSASIAFWLPARIEIEVCKDYPLRSSSWMFSLSRFSPMLPFEIRSTCRAGLLLRICVVDYSGTETAMHAYKSLNYARLPSVIYSGKLSLNCFMWSLE